jgi:hypothetical protein
MQGRYEHGDGSGDGSGSGYALGDRCGEGEGHGSGNGLPLGDGWGSGDGNGDDFGGCGWGDGFDLIVPLSGEYRRRNEV